MIPGPPIRPRRLLIAGLSGLLALAACAGRVAPPAETSSAKAESAPTGPSLREVTLFGVVATPGTPEIDPKLDDLDMAPQLRQFLGECTGCGIKLLGSETKSRLARGGSVTLDLEQGYSASAELVEPRDDAGKVRLKFTLAESGEPQFAGLIRTPPDQPSFIDKKLADGRRLLLMVGAH